MSETQDLDFDAYGPQRMVMLAEKAGVAKANLPATKLFVLAVLAGVFVAFGAWLYLSTIYDSEFGVGPTHLLGGVAFSLGLILVVIAGAELFTGNNLIVMAVAQRHVTLGALLRNWAIVYSANCLRAVLMVVAVISAGVAGTFWFCYFRP